MKKRLVLLMLAAVTPAAAQAAERLSVLVSATADRDAELADNVSEVVVAAIARRGGFQITSKEELRARLGLQSDKKLHACVEDPLCLGRTAVSLGVRRIVIGTVATRGKTQFLFNLNLTSAEQGRVDNRVFRLVDGTLDEFIRAVQAGTDELFRPKVEPGRIQITSAHEGARVSVDNAYVGVTPVISGTLLPGAHTVRVEADGRFPWASKVEVLPGQDLGIKLTEKNLPPRRLWPAYAAVGSGGVGLAAFGTGGLLSLLSRQSPSGTTRAEQMHDFFDQKKPLADAATGALITGGVLVAVSLALFIVYREDIFGRAETER